ncbi:MAG: hypothetical protein AB7I37_19530 [Pirellulales bacterium]
MVASLDMSTRFIAGRLYRSQQGDSFVYRGVNASGRLSFADDSGHVQHLTQAVAAMTFGTRPIEATTFAVGLVYRSQRSGKVLAFEGVIGGLLSFRDGHGQAVRLTADEAREAFGDQDGLDPLWDITGVSPVAA